MGATGLNISHRMSENKYIGMNNEQGSNKEKDETRVKKPRRGTVGVHGQ
jgi:hypothetical protein